MDYNAELVRISAMNNRQLAEYISENKVIDKAVTTIMKDNKKPELLKLAMGHVTELMNSQNKNIVSNSTSSYINKFDTSSTLASVNKWIEGESVILARPVNKNGKMVNLFVRIETNDKAKTDMLRAYTLKINADEGSVMMKPYGFKSGWIESKKDAQQCIGFKGYSMDNKTVKSIMADYEEYLPDDKETAKQNKSTPQYESF